MRPFHHGGESGEPTSWLQGFNDSAAGVLLAGILHSVGALLFAGGIALYLYVAQSIRRAGKDGIPANVGLLAYAHGFTLSGIALNGVGGVMRLYESDHPGLSRLGDSTWVQVLLVKHLFLTVGVGLAVWLAWRTRNLAPKARRSPIPLREGSRMTWYAAASLSTILLAAVLGAVAGNVDLAADLGQVAPEDAMDQHANHGEALVLADVTSRGTITGAPGNPGSNNEQVSVPEGADRITVVLTWATASTQGLSPVDMNLVLKDGAQATVEGQTTRVERALTVVVPAERVTPGRWTITVTSERAVQEAYTLHVTIVRSNGQGNLINRTITVAPDKFFEANLLMGSGKTLNYDWQILNSTTRTVYFDIHLHVDGQVRYPVQGNYTSHRGSYTHDGSTQGPSLLWENRGSDPVEIHFRITGDFSLHSYHPA